MTKVEQARSNPSHTHVNAEARTLDAPLLRLDLAQELADVRRDDAYKTGGHNAKTLARYPDLRLVLIALDGGKRLEQHQTKGRVSIHVIEGKVTIGLDTEKVELGAGCLLEVAPGAAHDVEAMEPSALLLTIAWPVAADATKNLR
jgi:quercetin dioxygenase-like cupin family protein